MCMKLMSNCFPCRSVGEWIGITADLPANTQFLSPGLFINNWATAAAVAYNCSGVYLETDYQR